MFSRISDDWTSGKISDDWEKVQFTFNFGRIDTKKNRCKKTMKMMILIAPQNGRTMVRLHQSWTKIESNQHPNLYYMAKKPSGGLFYLFWQK